MKPLTITKLFCVLALIVNGLTYAQTLTIDGRFMAKNKRRVQANYTLVSNNKVIKSGNGKKIRTKLALNQQYTLTIEKPGFESKCVNFSTYTKQKGKYHFRFDAMLKPKSFHKVENDTIKNNILVYYNSKREEFNYTSSKGNKAKLNQ